MKTVESIMQKRVVTVEPDDTLHAVKDIFDHTHFHHVLVIEQGRLKGVISDRDLLKSISPNIGTAAELPRDSATLNKHAHQIMSRNPITLEPCAGIDEAVALLMEHMISCIPIVDALMQVKGIVSWRDLLPEII